MGFSLCGRIHRKWATAVDELRLPRVTATRNGLRANARWNIVYEPMGPRTVIVGYARLVLTEPTFAVVIATRNRAEKLDRCLASIAKQRRPPMEVIVVSDASTDSTATVLARWTNRSLKVRSQRLDRNVGPATARNVGIRSTSADFVAFTDDDCVVEPGWLEALASSFEKAPPAFGGIGGHVVPLRPGIIADYMTFHRILEPPDSCSYLVTANCMYRRSVLVEVRGFDENVRWAGGEDPGLAFKVRDAGHRLGYCADAVVQHEYRESLRDFARTFFRYGRGCRVVMG